MKKLTLSKVYVKYMIKTPLVFYVFLLVSVAVYLFMAMSVKLDIIDEYEGIICDDYIVITAKSPIETELVYIVIGDGERIKLDINKSEFNLNDVKLYFNEDLILTSLREKKLKVEVVVGKRNLLDAMYKKMKGGA